MPLLPVLSCVAGLLVLSFLAVTISRSKRSVPLIYGACVLLLLPCLVASFDQIFFSSGIASKMSLPIGLPWMRMHFRLDGLSSYFLMIISALGALSSFYGLSYGTHEKEQGRVLPFYPMFLAGMILVVIADDAFGFLVAWEFMSLSSWFLVLSTHKEHDTSFAAYIYLVMACLGTVALILTFGLLAGHGGDYGFDAMRAQKLTPFAASAVMLLTLVGAGAKAGVFPLHAWLPLAHPAAPSHVSALMSGVMTKVAIYGIVRIMFDLVGVPQGWWGGVIMLLGGITAVMGVLYALMQHDLKKLLAYHTVENIGIIVIGLGLALAFRAYDMPALAALALTAALFHVLNHALFKSLLFLGAGNILTATGLRDMEKAGGLIHRMPITAFTFLIGAAAISALPPFNGFVSEWLTFQAILSGVALPPWGLKFLIPAIGALLALAAALAAVCFVKVFGVVFLGRAHTPAAAEAKEVDKIMLTPMVVLSALCAIIGLFPSLVLGVLRPVVTGLMPDVPLPLSHSSWLMLVPMDAESSSYSGLIILVVTGLLTMAVIVAIHHFASDKVRRGAIWDCGFPDPSTDTQYTASSFAQPIRRVFGTTLFAAKDNVDMPRPGEQRSAHFSISLTDPAWKGCYEPVGKAVQFLARKFDPLQFFSIRRYLGMMFVSLILLLIIVAVMQ